MFNGPPGTMLKKGHTLQCQKGPDCDRFFCRVTPLAAPGHTLFNPVPAGGPAEVCATILS